jgi:hypothetical protein
VNITRVVRAAASLGLAGHEQEGVFPRPSGDDWPRLLDAVRDERLEGLFTRLIADGRLPVTDEQRAEAEAVHVEAMALAIRIDDLVRRVARAFDKADIPMRVLKGPASARLDHAEPSLRSYGDADVLVPGRTYEMAGEILRGEGFARRTSEFTPGFDRRFAKAVTYVSSDGLEIDLHRSIVYGPFSVGISEAELWRPGTLLDFGGTSVETFDITRRFLHACVHAALGSSVPRLTALRDVAMIGSRAVDPDAVTSIAACWRIEPVVARAAALVNDYLGVDLDWLPRPAPRRSRDFRLRCSVDDRSPWSSATVGLLVTLPRWSDRLALARMLSSSLRTDTRRPVRARVRSFASAGWRNVAPRAAVRPRAELSLR